MEVTEAKGENKLMIRPESFPAIPFSLYQNMLFTLENPVRPPNGQLHSVTLDPRRYQRV